MTTAKRPIVQRQAVRAIVLSPQREVLLMQIRLPGRDDSFWITPGGGIDPGESLHSCLRRELREELGLSECAIGPLVWRREHTFDWGEQRVCQREQYFIVHAERFEPNMTDAIELQVLQRFRWWPLEELAVTRVPLAPAALATIVQRYLAHGAPSDALELEFVVD